MNGDTHRHVTAVGTLLVVLVALALGAAVLAGTAAADDGEGPTYELQLDNDGDSHAVGVPAETTTPLEEVFADGIGGDDGIDAVYTLEDGEWTQADFDEPLGSLDAIVVVTSGDEGPDEIDLAMTFAPEDDLPELDTHEIDPGWNFVAPRTASDVDDAFGFESADLVIDSFDNPSVDRVEPVDSFPPTSVGDGEGTAVSPFTGYFVFAESEATVPSAYTGADSLAAADLSLGLDLVDAESMTMELSDEELGEGATTDGTVEVAFEDGATAEMTPSSEWSSSDDAVATVDEGHVAAESSGSTDIAADYDELDDDVELTVTESGDVDGTVTEGDAESSSSDIEATSDEPLAGVTVGVEGYESEDYWTTTDDDGTFTIENVPVGDQDVVVDAPTHQSERVSVSVEDNESTDAAATLDPSGSFTAYVEDGQMEIGEEDYVIDFPACTDGTPDDPEGHAGEECTSFLGDLDSVADGTADFGVDSQWANFPPLQVYSEVEGDELDVLIDAPDGFSGEIDTATNSLTLSGPVTVDVGPETFEDCTLDTEITVEDEAGLDVADDVGHATVVDDTFHIDGLEGCDDLADEMNDEVGFPAGDGDNVVTLDLRIEFDAADEPEPTVDSLDLELDEDLLDGEATEAPTVATFDHHAIVDVTEDATYSSSDEDNVSVADDGTVTAESVGTATVTTEYDGHTDEVTVEVSEPETESIDLSLDDETLVEAETTDATVVATLEDGTEETVTDSATLTALDEHASVDGTTVTAEERGTAVVEAEYADETDEVELTVEPQTGDLDGQVEDDEDGEPIADAAVWLADTDFETETDDDGSFAFEDVPTGTYDLKANANLYQTGTLSSVEVTADDTVTESIALEQEEVSLTLEADDEDVGVDEVTTLTATRLEEDEADQDVTDSATLSTEDTDVVDLDADAATVEGLEEGTATIEATYDDEDFGELSAETTIAVDDLYDMEAFTAYGQEGTIVLAGDTDDPIQLPESDEDEPLPENAPEDVEWEDESFTIDVDNVDLDGHEDETVATWSAGADDITFPVITSYDVDADYADVVMTAPDGFEGTVNLETGEVTANGNFVIEAQIRGAMFGMWADCRTETSLTMSTGEGEYGQVDGSSLTIDEDAHTGVATLADDSFTVPGFETIDGDGIVCGEAEDEYGLPAETPGENTFEYELWLDLTEAE